MGALSQYLAGKAAESGDEDSSTSKWANRSDKGTAAVNSTQALTNFKKGGKVKKTGVAKVHRGERVLTKAQAKHYNKHHKRVCGK